MKQAIRNRVIHWGLKLRSGWHWRSLRRAANHPQQAQWQVLQPIVTQNQSTTFGRAHQFATINSIDSFRTQVPIQTYASLQPYIVRQRDAKESALTQEAPVLYAQTSGTTGEPKYIPMTLSALNSLKKQQQIVAYHFLQACPQAFDGDALAIVSPAIEGYFDSGVPYGSASGCIHDTMPHWVREKFVIPPSVFAIKDYDLKYRIILCLALAHRNITYIACANPSTLVRLMTLANEQLGQLITCIETGDITALGVIDDVVKKDITAKLIPSPGRAQQLKRLMGKSIRTLTDMWPELRLISTWTAGSCGVALSHITHQLPETVKVMDIGYLASELRSTVTVDSKTQSGLPLVNDHFYEFVEEQAWEQGQQATLLLHQLQLGKSYYVIVTTNAGLYRYFMNDLITVTGYYHETPLIKFLQKGKGVTSITGEKLYESQLLDAMDCVMVEKNLSTVFVMGLADPETHHYQVFIETRQRPSCSLHEVAGLLDNALRDRNLEYDTKRASGRLHHLETYWLREGAYEAYKRFCMQQGQREGQFKLIALQYRQNFPFSFDQWIQY